MEDHKPWSGLARYQNSATGRGLEPKAKMSKLGNVVSKLV